MSAPSAGAPTGWALAGDRPVLPGASAVHVAFTDANGLGWLRWLKPGYRHCLVLVEGAGWWLLVDPLASATRITVMPAEPCGDGAAYLAAQGLLVATLPAPAEPDGPAPAGPFTCVENVKRLLGLRARRIVTPWQLYRRLAAEGAAITHPTPVSQKETSHGCSGFACHAG